MKRLIFALALAALALPARAQTLNQNLPANTVVGRLGAGTSGPAQAIPLATFGNALIPFYPLPTYKAPVVAASTGSNVSTTSAPSSLDGVTLAAGNRILLKDQTTGSENGIYTFSAAGSALTRATDWPASSSSAVVQGTQIFVTQGTRNSGAVFSVTTTGAILVGTTSVSLFNAPTNLGTSVIGSAAAFWNPTYFSNAGTGVITRANRLKIGAASLSSGDVPQGTPDWLESLGQTFSSGGQVTSISTVGELALVGASRCSDFRTWAGSASGGCQGVTGFGYQDDNGSGTPIAVGVNGVAIRKTGVTAGIALNQFDANNGSTVVDVTPFGGVVTGSIFASGFTAGAYSALGTANVSAGTYFGGGATAKFRKGTVYFDGSLDATVGAGGDGVATEYARNMSLRWLNNGGTTDAEFWGNASGLTLPQTLNLGVAGSALGTLKLSGNTSGTITVAPQATAGTATFTLPNASGTPAISVPSPLSLSATTGAVTWSGLTTNGILVGSGATSVVNNRCTMDSNGSISCSSGSAFQPPMTLTNSASDTNGTNIVVAKSKGGGAVDSGTVLGGFAGQAFTSSMTSVGSVQFQTTGAVSGANVPVALKFNVSNASGALNQTLEFDAAAHISIPAQSNATSVTSCGTNPSLKSGSTDTYGEITMGTGSPTACTLSFGTAYSSAPHCVVTWQSNLASMQYTIGTGSISITQTATSSNKINYMCHGS